MSGCIAGSLDGIGKLAGFCIFLVPGIFRPVVVMQPDDCPGNDSRYFTGPEDPKFGDGRETKEDLGK